MFYTVYRVTNKENGKVYIGKHATEDLDDDYLGSGNLIKAAVRKYGRECFEKEILTVCETEEEMNALEASFVTEDFVRDPNTYNLIPGGQGGFGFINTNGLGMSAEKGRLMNAVRNARPLAEKSKWARKAWETARDRQNGIFSEKARQKKSETMTGRKHSPETIALMKQQRSDWSKGETNSQFGTFWITDGVFNKKLKSGTDVPDGWYRGRTT